MKLTWTNIKRKLIKEPIEVIVFGTLAVIGLIVAWGVLGLAIGVCIRVAIIVGGL